MIGRIFWTALLGALGSIVVVLHFLGYAQPAIAFSALGSVLWPFIVTGLRDEKLGGRGQTEIDIT